MGGVLAREQQVPVSSLASELVPKEVTCTCQLFQSLERPEGGRESETRSSIRSSELGVHKREHTRSVDTSVQRACTSFCHSTDRSVPYLNHTL